jgi:hypothetical protein
MAPLHAAPNGQPAHWLVAGLHGFGESVLSLVPAGFSAYVRIFHPAQKRIGSREIAFVSWHEIAAANGKQAHAGMQFVGLTGMLSEDGVGQPSVFDHPPESGSLPEELALPLATVLAHNTSTADRCWFAVWEGWGGLPDEALRAPTFSVPGREYYLLTGPVDALAGGAYDFLGLQSPNLVWPEDRAWCLATEVDLDTTYLGCDDACSAEVVSLPELEALAVNPATPFALG